MNNCDEFYRLRDRRTIAYAAYADALTSPVAVVVGADVLATEVGRVLLKVLVDLLVRVHRDVTLVGGAVSRDTALVSELEQIAFTVNPCIEFAITGHRPDGAIAVGIGHDVPPQLAGYAGARGWTAVLADRAQPLGETPGTLFGGGLAVCLAAARLFRAVHDEPMKDGSISLWTLANADPSASGPADPGRLSLGDVLVVGAGAVGSALCHWASTVDIDGGWEFIDGDTVELHNTSRSLGLLPRHAGWPDGTATNKAKALCEGLPFGFEPLWYDQWTDRLPDRRPDLLIPAANERGVRQLIQQRGQPLIVHATTSRSWQAQLHRHVPSVDQCISCRFPEGNRATPVCAAGPVTPGGDDSDDAALPFLSAAAGLMLLAGLYHLQEGRLEEATHNLWSISFARSKLLRLSIPPEPGCAHVVPAAVRERLQRS